MITAGLDDNSESENDNNESEDEDIDVLKRRGELKMKEYERKFREEFDASNQNSPMPQDSSNLDGSVIFSFKAFILFQ